MAFLNEEGLTYFWNQILARLNNFVPAESGKGLSTNDYTSEDKAKLAALSTSAEANQNAFSYIVAGGKTVAADSKTDTVKFLTGDNIVITPDVNNDTIKFSVASPLVLSSNMYGDEDLTTKSGVEGQLYFKVVE